MSTTKDQRPNVRLKQLRKRLGKSQAEMAELLNISTTGYQNYERGEREIPVGTVDRAREQVGLNPRWLFEGIGEMFLDQAPTPEAERVRVLLGLDASPPKPRRLSAADKTSHLHSFGMATGFKFGAGGTVGIELEFIELHRILKAALEQEMQRNAPPKVLEALDMLASRYLASNGFKITADVVIAGREVVFDVVLPEH